MRPLLVVLLTTLLSACDTAPPISTIQPMEHEPPPRIDALWDFTDPAGTEAAFRSLLDQSPAQEDPAYCAELLTQIARAQGLQQHFNKAHATLDQAESLLANNTYRVRVRVLLERGRVTNSAGDPDASVIFFEQALDLAQAHTLEYDAVDAAHMLGIVTQGEDAIQWNEEALRLAESAREPRARKWVEVLCNNLGWTYHRLGRHDEARKMFERQLPLLQGKGQEKNLGICRWSIAKMHRHLGRAEEALAVQLVLLDDPHRQTATAEGYTREEVGECLLLLDRPEEARPHFARAWELLHTDPWLSRDEQPRLERMKRLGGVE